MHMPMTTSASTSWRSDCAGVLLINVGVKAARLQHDGRERGHDRDHPVKLLHGRNLHRIGKEDRHQICTQEVPKPQAERQERAVEQFGELQIDFLLPAQHSEEDYCLKFVS